MKVFLSWSGERSKHIAEALRVWLPRVIQAVRPWMSDVDIPAGARWQTDIAHELDEAHFGIICVTPENMNKPWLMFEAGALSKSMKASRVCPLAYSMKLSDLSGPIAQFQANTLDRDGIFQVIKAINAAIPDKGLDPAHLLDQFELLWGRLDQALKSIPIHSPPERQVQAPISPTPDDPEELIQLVHNMADKVSSVDNHLSSNRLGEQLPKYKFDAEPELTYSPVSSLEGALIGLSARNQSQRSFQSLASNLSEDLEKWHKVGASVPGILIDLSIADYFSKENLEILRVLGEKYPNSMEVGISEKQITSNQDGMRSLAKEFRMAGFHVGIKGFGTGYSALSFLQQLPLSTIWIDRSFIHDIASDTNDKMIVSAIISLAKNLGLALVAEGVSNVEQSKVLLELGVKNITGSMAGDVMTGDDVYKRIST